MKVPYPQGFAEQERIEGRLAEALRTPAWPELGDVGERALCALNALELERGLIAEGRGDEERLLGAAKEWAVLKVEFGNAVRRVGELVRVGLLCLADADPAALAKILERAGLTAAAERLADVEATATGLRHDLEDLRRELDGHRAKTWGAFQLLDKLEAHADRIRYDLERMEAGRPAPGSKPKSTWQEL